MRCSLRAWSTVWWPGLSQQITDLINQCLECSRDATLSKEPLMPMSIHGKKLGSTQKGVIYILLLDCFLEVIELKSLTSSSVIVVMKSIFSRHGPQYRSAEFASQYDFTHSTSSPYFLQSKSNAERTMKTVKKHLKELKDQSLSLLAYNVTPLPWCRTADGQAIKFIQMSPRWRETGVNTSQGQICHNHS